MLPSLVLLTAAHAGFFRSDRYSPDTVHFGTGVWTYGIMLGGARVPDVLDAPRYLLHAGMFLEGGVYVLPGVTVDLHVEGGGDLGIARPDPGSWYAFGAPVLSLRSRYGRLFAMASPLGVPRNPTAGGFSVAGAGLEIGEDSVLFVRLEARRTYWSTKTRSGSSDSLAFSIVVPVGRED